MNETFKYANFDFSNKYIGFVNLVSGGFYGIGYYTWDLKKKDLLKLDINKCLTKLIILDTIQKIESYGYDALFVVVLKKNKGKLKKLNLSKLISEMKNRYPQIPINAGLDTNSNLNTDKAKFFNEIYKSDVTKKLDFDFNGKKIAIFNSFEKFRSISIPEYVTRFKTQLDTYGFALYDFIYYLNAEQKKESGGYDVIIQYKCKKDFPVEYLIKLIDKNNL